MISVVIPAYNRATTIKECIDSVLAQTYSDIEVIVVDDCSKDNTVEVVNSYTDPRVKKCITYEPNRGACYARNLGAANAAGEYIAFQDSDDTWMPDKLEKQLAYLQKGGYDMVFCGMKRVDEENGRTWYFPNYEFDENKDALKQILYDDPIGTQCIFITKEAFERVKFDESIKKFQDWDFSIRAAGCCKIGYLNEPLAISVLQPNSITKKVPRYKALQVIYNKYNELIVADEKIHMQFLHRLGNSGYREDPKNCAVYLSKVVKYRFDMKSFIKLVYCKIKRKK